MAQPTNMYDVYKGAMGSALANGTTAESLAKDDFKNSLTAVAASPVAIPIALVDGTLQALEGVKNIAVSDMLGFKQLESDRFNDTAASTLIEKVGLGGFADLYQKNRGAYNAAGDVVTLFTGAGAVRSGVRQGAKKATDVRSGLKVRGESTAGTLANIAMLPTRATMVPYNVGVQGFASSKAGKFVFGDYSIVQRQIDELDNIAMSVTKGEKQLTDFRASKSYVDSVANLQKAQLKQSVREAAATEALIFASLHDSDFIFPEGMSAMDHAFWTTVGIAIPTGIDQIVLNATLRKTAARGGAVVEEARSAAGYFSTADASTTFLMNGKIASTANNAIDGLQGVARKNNDVYLANAQTGLRRGTEKLGAATPIETLKVFQPTKAQENMVAKLATDNPDMFRGITSFNELPRGKDALPDLGFSLNKVVLEDEFSSLAARDDKTRADYIRMDVVSDQLTAIDNTTAHGLDVDGTVFGVGQRQDTIYDDFINVQRGPSGFNNAIGQSRGDTLTPAGKLTRKVKTPSMANLKDVTNTYALMPAAKAEYVEELRKAVVGGKTSKVESMLTEFTDNMGNGEKLTYLEIDYAVEVMQAMKDEPLLLAASQQLAGKFATGQIDSLIGALQTAGLQKKYDDLKRFVATNKSSKVEVTPMDLSRRYNLALHHGDSTTPTPVFDVLMSKVARGDGQFKSYGEFKAQVDLLAASKTAADASEINVAIKGNNLKLDLDTQPVVYTVDSEIRSVQENMSITAAAEVLQAEKIDRTTDGIKYFADMDGGIFAQTLARIEQSGLSEQIREGVRRIVGGQEGQAAVRGGKGQVAASFNSIVPQDRQFRNRNVEALALIDGLMDGVYKAAQKQTTEMFKPYKETYRKFHATRQGKQDQLSMNLYLNARGAGFDIDVKTSGKFGETKLLPTTKNIDLLATYVGKARASKLFEGGTLLLPDMTQLRKGVYEPVYVSEGAEEIMNITNKLYRNVQDNRNVLRYGGQEEVIDVNNLMLPPAFTGNKEIAVIMKRGSNEIDEIVFGTSPQQAMDKANKLANGETQHVASRAEVEQILPHRLNNALAESSYNSAGSANVDGALALEGMNRWMIDSMNNVAKSSVNRIFEPEINFLAQQQKLHSTFAPSAIGDRKQVSVYESARNVFLNNRDEATGNFVINAQSRIDGLLDAGLGFTAEALNGASSVLKREGKATGKLLDDFAQQAGYRPTEAAFERAGLGLPSDAQSVARKLNGMAGFFLLRLGEASQALLNVASIPTVVPALHSQLAMRTGEGYNEYRKRVGGFADLVGKGNLGVAPSPIKGMINAVHLYGTEGGRVIMKEAEALGNMYAPAVELQEHVFTRGRVLDNKYFDKAAELMTLPTDWTEKFSRQLSYLQGYDMLRRMSPDMTKMELHTASNAFANRAVGDYRTVNKPQQFQGGIGSSMGLFQTFFINYWQRMGDMLESGNKRGLVTLYGTQASMFGLESLPGYDVYNQMWSNYDGSVAPTDLFAESFGVETSEVMLTGGLSNIPKLFGQDGIALYSRGDTNVRQIPNITNALQVPALNMVAKVGKGVAEYGRTARALGELPSRSRTMEIVAGSVPNRPAAGIMEIINGHAVNRGGDLTVKDTRDSAVRLLSRVMGAKTIEEDRTAKVMWRQKLQQRKSQASVSTMRRDFAAQIRDNNGQLSVKMLDKFHAKHYEKLQNPDTFNTWIGNLYKKSVDEKASKDMLMLYKRIADGDGGPYADMQMRRLTQLLIANQTAMAGAAEIANR